jgi:hypothetical protein
MIWLLYRYILRIFVDDVLLNGRFGVNIITKELRAI